MLKKAVKHILLLSNATGVVIGACVLVSFLVLATIRQTLGLPFSISAVDQLLQGLAVGGALVLIISIVGYCALVKEEWKSGKWLLIPYVIALSVITGIQIYIMTILLLSKSAMANDVITSTKSAVQQTSKVMADVGRSGWNAITHSVLPDSNIITIYSTPKGTNKERLKRELSYFSKAYDRIKDKAINAISVDDIIVPNHDADIEISPINKQTQKLNDFLNFQLIKNKSLEMTNKITHTLGRTAYDTGRKLGDIVSQPAMKVGRIIKTELWDNNKYVDLLKPILGDLSKPVLYASEIPAVLASEMIIVLVQILYISMAIFYCVVKFKTL